MRVISGKARGVPLKAPEGWNTRPTTDRVKENLFNLIQQEILDRKVLDLFSGTGALAIEALSRGASSAVLVESDKKCYNVIDDNLARARMTGQATVLRLEVPQALKQLSRDGMCFGLLLMDPPYGQGWVVPILEQAQPLLMPGAVAVIEHEAEMSLPERIGRLLQVKHRIYGKTAISIYKEETPNESGIPGEL